MSTIKTELYADGKYVCSTNMFTSVRSALAVYSKAKQIRVAGVGNIELDGKKLEVRKVQEFKYGRLRYDKQHS